MKEAIMEKRSKEKIINLEIYTDGSCKKLGKFATFGGWAFIAVRDNIEIYEAAGNTYDTSNQKMELLAISKALEYANSARGQNERVIIYSDSAYVINCYQQQWYENWKINGWKNSKKQPVANQDLWLNIIPYFDNFWYDFKKVEGHNGVFWNEECDKMAQQQADAIKFGPRSNNE